MWEIKMDFDLGHTISSLAKLALRTKRNIDKQSNEGKKKSFINYGLIVRIEHLKLKKRLATKHLCLGVSQ